MEHQTPYRLNEPSLSPGRGMVYGGAEYSTQLNPLNQKLV